MVGGLTDGGYCNVGTRAIEISGGVRIHRADEPYPLRFGYTALMITGAGGWKDVQELCINNVEGPVRGPGPDGRIVARPPWELTDEQRLVLVVLGQRYHLALLGDAE